MKSRKSANVVERRTRSVDELNARKRKLFSTRRI